MLLLGQPLRFPEVSSPAWSPIACLTDRPPECKETVKDSKVLEDEGVANWSFYNDVVNC